MFNLTKISNIPYIVTITVKVRGLPVDINMQCNCLAKGNMSESIILAILVTNTVMTKGARHQLNRVTR